MENRVAVVLARKSRSKLIDTYKSAYCSDGENWFYYMEKMGVAVELAFGS